MLRKQISDEVSIEKSFKLILHKLNLYLNQNLLPLKTGDKLQT